MNLFRKYFGRKNAWQPDVKWYVGYPVTVAGRMCRDNGKPLHMTLKYFGSLTEAEFRTIRRQLNCANGAHPRPDAVPTTECVFSQWNDMHHVVVLPNWVHLGLTEAYKAFDHTRPNQFPLNPHVTLDREFWLHLGSTRHNDPQSFLFGRLALFGNNGTRYYR